MEEKNAAAADVLGGILDGLGLSYERQPPGAYLVRLDGEHKLATMTWLIAGTHSLAVEAFFCRQPDENHAAFYRFLLERNGRMYGVRFTLDPVGDVYLTGRLPLCAVSTADIDRLLGCVLSYSDENFDTALELGFASAIRREWAWRSKRGESLANLQAFARFADPERLAPYGGEGPLELRVHVGAEQHESRLGDRGRRALRGDGVHGADRDPGGIAGRPAVDPRGHGGERDGGRAEVGRHPQRLAIARGQQGAPGLG